MYKSQNSPVSIALEKRKECGGKKIVTQIYEFIYRKHVGCFLVVAQLAVELAAEEISPNKHITDYERCESER